MRRAKPMWFRCFAEVPGVGYVSDPSRRARLPNLDVIPKVERHTFDGERIASLMWPSGEYSTTMSPVHQFAFGAFQSEPSDQVRERVLGGLQRLRAGHQNEAVCLVAHGIPVRILILEALGLGLDRIWSLHSAPTGISELEFRDDWTALHRMNTLVHLDTVLAGR